MGGQRNFPALGFDPAPGDVSAVTAFGDSIASATGMAGQAHGTLSEANAGSWSGPAADAFSAKVGVFAGHVGDLRSAMASAGKAIGTWADELSAMQSTAEKLEAEAAAAQQRLESAQADPALKNAGKRFSNKQDAQEAQQKYQQAAAETAAAQQALDSAREQAKQLQEKHSQLAQQTAAEMTGNGLVDPFGVLSGVNGNVRPGLHGELFRIGGPSLGANGRYDVDGYFDPSFGPDNIGIRAGARARGELNEYLSHRFGPLNVYEKGGISGDVGVNGDVEIGRTGITQSAQAKAEAKEDLSVGATLDSPLGKINNEVGVTGTQSADAHVTSHVGTDGFNLGAGASAGAGADVHGKTSAGGLGLSGYAGGGEGVGASAGAHATVDKSGTYHFGADLSGAFGFKGDAGGEISVNPDQVKQTTDHLGDELGNKYGTAGRVAAAPAEAAGNVLKGADSVADGARNFLNNFGK